MARAVRALSVAAAFALVDGNDAPALPCPCDTLVDGDARSVSIAAASIIAKVTRDRHDARRCTTNIPVYGWITNKGYGTEEHLDGAEPPWPDPPSPPQLRACPQHLVWWISSRTQT